MICLFSFHLSHDRSQPRQEGVDSIRARFEIQDHRSFASGFRFDRPESMEGAHSRPLVAGRVRCRCRFQTVETKGMF